MDGVEIDYAILAEHAEVANNKLYLMGGGWDTMAVPDVPATVRLTMVAGVRVDWDETNVQIPMSVRVTDEDAQEVLRIDGSMNVGRPPQLVGGSSQLSQMTFVLNMGLPRFGGYQVTFQAGAGDAVISRSLPFRLTKGAAPIAKPQTTTPPSA
jgi:hypothetical protein